MRLMTGITNSSYGVYDNDGTRKIKEQGYDCIDYQGLFDLRCRIYSLPQSELDEYLDEKRAKYEKIGIKLSQAHSTWPLPEGDDEEFTLYVEAAKKTAYCAMRLGCPRLVVHPIYPFQGTYEEAVSANVSVMRRVGEYARELGITLCVENLPFREYLAASVEGVCRIVDEVALPNVRVCLDTGHAAIFNPDVADAVRYIGDRLEALHIHDNGGESDEHLVPGDGIIDWDAFALALAEIGYKGVVSLETSPGHGKYPECEWQAREQILYDKVRRIADIASGACADADSGN